MEEPDGRLPVLLPMSETMTRLAPVFAGQLLTNTAGGRGILLSGLPGVACHCHHRRRRIAGTRAARAFVGTSAQVIVLGQPRGSAEPGGYDVQRHRDHHDGQQATTSTAWSGFADVLVGAVLLKDGAPVLITREMVRKMRPGSVVMDFHRPGRMRIETSRPHDLTRPHVCCWGVIHFCVPNLPARGIYTSSHVADQRCCLTSSRWQSAAWVRGSDFRPCTPV